MAKYLHIFGKVSRHTSKPHSFVKFAPIICIESIEILHVRFPCFSQCLLLILYFQTIGQFKYNVINESETSSLRKPSKFNIVFACSA